jgi:hypothetical protein
LQEIDGLARIASPYSHLPFLSGHLGTYLPKLGFRIPKTEAGRRGSASAGKAYFTVNVAELETD